MEQAEETSANAGSRVAARRQQTWPAVLSAVSEGEAGPVSGVILRHRVEQMKEA